MNTTIQSEINPYHNTNPDKRNPFVNKGENIPPGKKVKRSVMLKAAADLSQQYQKSCQIIRHRATQLTGLYNGMANPLYKKVHLGRIKARPVEKMPNTLKNRQVVELLKRFDYLFKFWGIRYPLGLAKGRHLWSDDIANAARLAFFEGFIPHCETGHVDCNSSEFTYRKVLHTPTGRIKRSLQSVTNEAGKIVTHRLKPSYRIKKEFHPSCEKAAIYALKGAKFAAMQAASQFTRHGLRETVFSSLDLKPGQDVVGFLESLGENPVTFANEIGIQSPWMDHTLQNLSECLSNGIDRISISHNAIREMVTKCEAIDGRVNKALQVADKRGLMPALFLRMAGLEWAEVASVEGIKPDTLKKRLYRLRGEVNGIKPAA